MHLIGSLGWPAYVRFGVWLAVGLLIYGLYGAQAAEERERQLAMQRAAVEEEEAAEGHDVYELPFQLPSLEYEGAVGESSIELPSWSPLPSLADTDTATLLQPGRPGSAAVAGSNVSSGWRPP